MIKLILNFRQANQSIQTVSSLISDAEFEFFQQSDTITFDRKIWEVAKSEVKAIVVMPTPGTEEIIKFERELVLTMSKSKWTDDED